MKYAQLVKAIDSASQQLLGRAAAVVNQALILRNWLIGAYLVEFEQRGEDRAKYGEMLLARLSSDLGQRGLKGVSRDMLERMRTFFVCYPQIGDWISASAMRKSLPAIKLVASPISASVMRKSTDASIIPLSAESVLRLSWTQLIELIRLDDPLKRAFYENECLKGNWSVRQLQRQIGSLLYERTGLSTNKAAVLKRARRQEPQPSIANLIRDPYILEFTGLADRAEYHESDLEKALLNDLQSFLLELGTGFCFEARQFRVTTGNDHDYLDLVFYHRILRCHVLVDLKVRAFKHADAGQMNYYVNYFNNRVMAPGDNPPVGIILCSDKDQTKVEFATAGMDNKLFVSRYLVALPSAEQLRRFVEKDRAQFEALAIQSEKGTSRGSKPRSRKSGRSS